MSAEGHYVTLIREEDAGEYDRSWNNVFGVFSTKAKAREWINSQSDLKLTSQYETWTNGSSYFYFERFKVR